MKYKILVDDKKIEISSIKIFIGLDRYRLTEVDNKLRINKMSDGETDDINIYPKATNVIEIF